MISAYEAEAAKKSTKNEDKVITMDDEFKGVPVKAMYEAYKKTKASAEEKEKKDKEEKDALEAKNKKNSDRKAALKSEGKTDEEIDGILKSEAEEEEKAGKEEEIKKAEAEAKKAEDEAATRRNHFNSLKDARAAFKPAEVQPAKRMSKSERIEENKKSKEY